MFFICSTNKKRLLIQTLPIQKPDIIFKSNKEKQNLHLPLGKKKSNLSCQERQSNRKSRQIPVRGYTPSPYPGSTAIFQSWCIFSQIAVVISKWINGSDNKPVHSQLIPFLGITDILHETCTQQWQTKRTDIPSEEEWISKPIKAQL